jgi:hypothetical protein
LANTIKQFYFAVRGGRASKPDEISTTPIINIHLRRWTTLPASETPVISPDLMSEREIDEHVKLLKDDLNAVAEAAKKAFRKKLAE